MTVAVEIKPSLRRRGLEELREFLLIAAYLYVCFGALILYKTAILQGQGIGFTPWGIALVKAAILAKFMLVGHALHIGGRERLRPLIWPTLQKSLIFLLFLLLLTFIEEIVVGLIHGRAIGESVAGVGGGTLLQLLATCLIMLLILIPYFAFRSLGEALGKGRLARMFFVDRSASI